MFGRRVIRILAFLGLLAVPGIVVSVTAERRVLNRPEDLLRGISEGIAIRSDGALELAPKIRRIGLQPDGGNPQPFTWCQAIDSRGRLYVGTGNEGRVFRITPSEGSQPFLQTEEIEVTAIVVDDRDHLFVAVSPPARLYRVTPEGESTLFFEFEERYVWALKRNSSGELFAATGERGILYRISPDGEGTVILDSDDPHIVSLALGPEELYAGTAGRGLVYRVDAAGPAEVLYESGADEVSALEVAPDGTLYMGLLDRQPAKAKADRHRDQKAVEAEQESLGDLPATSLGGEMLAIRPAPEALRGSEEIPKRKLIRSRILSRSLEGIYRTLWTGDREILYSLLFHGNALYAGTGSSVPAPSAKVTGKDVDTDRSAGIGGALRRIVGPDRHTLVARVPESQVTSLVARGDGLYAGTSNLGNLYWVDPSRVDSGSFTSAPVDAKLPARWGRIWWRGRAPTGTQIVFSTRTGNSARPNDSWGPWEKARPGPQGSEVASGSGRYLQWRLKITGASPEIREIGVSLLQNNVPPVIGHLKIDPPVPDDPADLPETPEDLEAKRDLPDGNGEADSAGWKIAWEGRDLNGDRLVFELQYRQESDASWQPLAERIAKSPYTWDPRSLPDGRYQIRLVASDSPDNPADRALTAEESSPVFVVDHTSPEVSFTETGDDPGRVRIEAVVTDNLSGIASLRYSIDPDVWIPLFPRDGICDSNREEVRIDLDRLPAGEHLIHLRATDGSHNVGSGTIPITIGR
ncbi:MAG: hypothetical protein V3U66_00405 [Acidobacteriota bacterium]